MLDKISDAILINDEPITECIFTVDENDKLQMRTVLVSALLDYNCIKTIEGEV